MAPLQRRYWNQLADEYHRITSIRVDDFHYGPQIPGERALRLLPPLASGQRALELGCGGAQNSIWLARRGLDCTAIDLSAAQLRHARRLAAEHQVTIRLVRRDLQSFHQAVTGPFDLVHSSHALEFVDDPARILAQTACLLRPGGVLVLSTVHPLYNGDWIDGSYEDEGAGAGGWGLFLSNYFEPPDDVRSERGQVRVISRAYPLSSWFHWIRSAGLDVTALEEPRAVPHGETPPYTSAAWSVADGELQAIPATVIFVARKPAG